MSVVEATPPRASTVDEPGRRVDWRRALPTLAAGVLATIYATASPPSLDLAAHLFRAKLFSVEGFGVWDNWWYGGHHTPGYSVLFPPLAAITSPQLVAAISAAGAAALFESIVHRHFGAKAWVGALWFAVATATDLYTGRLTFAFGVVFGMGSVMALQRQRPWTAAFLAVLTALASPVAALFVALAGAAYAMARTLSERSRKRPALGGLAVAAGALAPVLALAVAFPEGGNEPFIFMTFWPIPLICLATLYAFPRAERTIWTAAVLYGLGCLAAYLIPSPAGSNVSRLAPLIAGPLAAIALWPERKRLLFVVAIPLLYIQLQAPIRDLSTSAGNPSVSVSYWQPLLAFLHRQGGPAFRVEIPFTAFHWEAYEVAPYFPLARGWERQLDIEDDGLFYSGRLTAARYRAWLDQLAVRFVAVSDGPVDYSAGQERALIDHGLPYLTPIQRTGHWRIYAVRGPAPLAQGAATATMLGPSSVTLAANRSGSALVRVRFTPYWQLSGIPGCVAPDGRFTRVTLQRAGRVRLVIRFSAARIGARSPRCSPR